MQLGQLSSAGTGVAVGSQVDLVGGGGQLCDLVGSELDDGAAVFSRAR